MCPGVRTVDFGQCPRSPGVSIGLLLHAEGEGRAVYGVIGVEGHDLRGGHGGLADHRRLLQNDRAVVIHVFQDDPQRPGARPPNCESRHRHSMERSEFSPGNYAQTFLFKYLSGTFQTGRTDSNCYRDLSFTPYTATIDLETLMDVSSD